jgi:hypothetical protein
MPSFEKHAPANNRKSLASRIERSNRVMTALRQTLPAQMAMNLRREARGLHEAIIAADTVEDRVRLASAACQVRAQLLDVIGYPKRPASAPLKPGGRPLIPVDAMPVDVAEVIRAEEAADQPDTGS